MVTMERQIRCIVKPGERFDETQRIEKIGGWIQPATMPGGVPVAAPVLPWTLTEEEAIFLIESKTMAFYTMVDNTRADVKIAQPKTPGGRKYLTTDPDSFHKNNL